MRTSDRIALIYALSVGGAAAMSWMRGKRAVEEIAMDALVQGGLLGTGVNVAYWLSEDHQDALSRLALTNAGQESCSPTGKVSTSGLKLLSSINPDVLYRAARLGKAVMVAPEPADPHEVQLPNPG